MRILLIEDNPGDARLVREMLSEANGSAAELECEETLASGLERLASEQFDVLLLDLTLPDSRGLDTLQKVRPFKQPIPVVVLTGLEDDETAQKSLESGAQDYLVKGEITPDSLERAIRYALGRHSTEEALRQSEEHYRLLVESASDVILTTDLDLIVTYASPSVERQTGFTVEEVIGHDAREFITAESLDGIAEELADQLARQRETDVTPPVPVIIEVEQCRKDGSTYPVEANVGFLRDPDGTPYGIIVVSRNITEKRRVEEALRRTQFTVDQSADSIFWVTSEGKIIYANDEACRRRGYTKEEMLSFTISDINDSVAADNDLWKSCVERIQQEGHFAAEFRHRTKGGEVFPVEAMLKLFKLEKGWIFIANVRDITERKKAEEALLESRAALAKQAQELRDMLTIASHELRHPATIFKGYSHILLENADDLGSEVARDALRSIDRASDRLARTVNQLMDTSRIECGETSPEFEELEPRTLLDGITAHFKGAGANVVTSDKTGAGAVFKADPEKLRSVLGNLVENAIKFSPDGSPVEVCAEAVSGGFLFSVCDSGPSISEEHAELVFERFYQVEEVEHHSVPGIGLGLYIAKKIIDEHGGWIRYRPGEGGGSVFEFFIPEHQKAEVRLETEHEHVKAELSPLCEPRPPDKTRDDAGLDDNGTKGVPRWPSLMTTRISSK
jgi:PAS domain S-box-containing protein